MLLLDGVSVFLKKQKLEPPSLLFFATAVAVFFMLIFVGFSIATENYLFPALLVVTLIGIFFLNSNDAVAVFVLFGLVWVVQGPASSYFGFYKFVWLAFALAGLCFFKLIGRFLLSSNLYTQNGIKFGLWFWLVLAYFFVLVLSSLVHTSDPLQVIVGLKNQLPFWVLSVFLANSNLKENDWRRGWQFIIALLLIQLPFVFHQHFIVAPSRVSMGWDAVVGTFGGTQNAGGLNAVLVFHAIFAFSIALCLYNRRLLNRHSLFVLAFVTALIILLGEVKAVVVWFPVALILVYGVQLLKSPKRLIITLMIVITSLFVVGKVYEALYWKDVPQKGLSENTEHSVDYFFDTNGINYKTGEVSRGAAIALWVTDKELSLVERVIGYGFGASSSSKTITNGEIARRYNPLAIDATTLAIILWDGGVLSLVLYLFILISGIYLSFCVERKNTKNIEIAAYARSSRVGLVLLLMTVGYNSVLITDPSSQMFLAWIFGYLGYFSKVDGDARSKYSC